MPRAKSTIEAWMPQAADIMVRERKSLNEAITDLGIPLTSQEARNVLRTKSFQTLLRSARNAYHAEVGNDPKLVKNVIIGQMKVLADELEEQGDHDKAGALLFQLARIAGYVGEGGQINVFGSLTAKEFDDLRRKLDDEKQKAAPNVN